MVPLSGLGVRPRPCGVALVLSGLAALAIPAAAAGGPRAVYERDCADCHGSDGGGAAAGPAVPDFRDCNTASRATDTELVAEVRFGGAHTVLHRGAPESPRFDRATAAALIGLVRAFCNEPGWPQGELNPAAPLFTANAYPEDQVVLQLRGAADDERGASLNLIYSRRVGRLAALEVQLPAGAVEAASGGSWNGGVGDLLLAGKLVVYQNLARGSIATLGHELVLPTGDDDRGLGAGTVIFTPYSALTRLLPGGTALHAQLLGELPTDRDRSAPRLELRSSLGKTWSRGFGEREWSPMLEVLARRVFDQGERDFEVDLVPQFEVSLSRSKHVALGVGVVVPVTEASQRPTVFALDFTWDWFADGLFDGW